MSTITSQLVKWHPKQYQILRSPLFIVISPFPRRLDPGSRGDQRDHDPAAMARHSQGLADRPGGRGYRRHRDDQSLPGR